MSLELLALFGGVLVVVFYAGSGRVLFITRHRQARFGLGFLGYAVASFLAARHGVLQGRPWTS